MKRFVAGLAGIATAVLALPAYPTTAPAQAATVSSAAVDPVNALRQQFRTGRGVRFIETVRLAWKKDGTTVRRRGTLQFSPSGIIAADVVRRATSSRPLDEDNPVYVQHMINVDGKHYHCDVTPARAYLPAGKSWVRASIDRPLQKWGTVFGDQVLNVFEPATLALLLRTSTHRLPDQGGTQYRGTITQAELRKASRSFRETTSFGPISAKERVKITWRLWVDGKGLVTRLVTSDAFADLVDDYASDTRYIDWRSTVTVTAPPADQVIDEDDVDYSTRPQTPLNSVIEQPAGN
ncbi:hypothetical protein [Streptosporangium sp. NPDC049644]|uniref:hypothetical protein n=1 Tax=Streptosporangium sp. NPDC049644 TaxID=3155507 RepID=UPI0034332495